MAATPALSLLRSNGHRQSHAQQTQRALLLDKHPKSQQIQGAFTQSNHSFPTCFHTATHHCELAAAPLSPVWHSLSPSLARGHTLAPLFQCKHDSRHGPEKELPSAQHCHIATITAQVLHSWLAGFESTQCWVPGRPRLHHPAASAASASSSLRLGVFLDR